MDKRNYHITISGTAKSANPLTKLLACIIALAAIPLIFVAFTGVIALLLTAFVFIAAAAVFFKALFPATKGRDAIVEMDCNDAGVPPLEQGKCGGIKSTGRRRPVVIEHDSDG